MHRLCPHCSELHGEKQKVVKLKEPVEETVTIGDLTYILKQSHECQGCKCLFGEGKVKEN